MVNSVIAEICKKLIIYSVIAENCKKLIVKSVVAEICKKCIINLIIAEICKKFIVNEQMCNIKLLTYFSVFYICKLKITLKAMKCRGYTYIMLQ